MSFASFILVTSKDHSTQTYPCDFLLGRYAKGNKQLCYP